MRNGKQMETKTNAGVICQGHDGSGLGKKQGSGCGRGTSSDVQKL